MGRLSGQTALVTGASSGIGRATALAFAREGATVAVVARREERLAQLVAQIQDLGGEALACPADITDPAAVEALVGRTIERFGRLDLLVNNAGVNLPKRSMEDVSVEGWRTMMDLNLSAVFYCVHAALPAMRARGNGTIINVASWSGKRSMPRTGPAYCASKAGLVSLNESINLAERRNGIRSCVICPGEVETEALDRRPKPVSAAARATMMQSEDIAAAALFVATLPQRATVEELIIRPTLLRNPNDDPRMETDVDPALVPITHNR